MTWYTIVVEGGPARIGVQGDDAEKAFAHFVSTKYPKAIDKYTKQVQRKMPPSRETCTVRPATDVEIAEYERKRVKPTQVETLFAPEPYVKQKHRKPKKESA